MNHYCHNNHYVLTTLLRRLLLLSSFPHTCRMPLSIWIFNILRNESPTLCTSASLFFFHSSLFSFYFDSFYFFSSLKRCVRRDNKDAISRYFVLFWYNFLLSSVSLFHLNFFPCTFSVHFFSPAVTIPPPPPTVVIWLSHTPAFLFLSFNLYFFQQ